jgi:hypothetical protein
MKDKTALFYLVQSDASVIGKIEIAKFLLNSKCNVNHQDYCNVTCLNEAVKTNQIGLKNISKLLNFNQLFK